MSDLLLKDHVQNQIVNRIITNTSNDKFPDTAMTKISLSSPLADTSSNCSVLLCDLWPDLQSLWVLLSTWSPHEQLSEIFDWLSSIDCIVCLHWCSDMNDLVSLSQMAPPAMLFHSNWVALIFPGNYNLSLGLIIF